MANPTLEPNHISPAQLELLTRYRAGDCEAGGQLVKEYAGFVGSVAAAFPSQLDYYAKFQAGNIGFLQALEKYDASKAALATYAKFWIERAIRQATREDERIMRLPESVDEAHTKIILARRKLESEGQAEATLETVAAASGLSEARIRTIVAVFGLDLKGCPPNTGPMFSTGYLEGPDFAANLPSEAPTPYEAVAHQEQIGLLIAKLTRLNQADRAILCIQFGMGDEAREDNSTLPYHELGARLCCGAWKARESSLRAVARLRKMMEDRPV